MLREMSEKFIRDNATMFEIHEQDEMIHDFEEKLWITTIEKVVVGEDGSMTFQFRNGMEVTK